MQYALGAAFGFGDGLFSKGDGGGHAVTFLFFGNQFGCGASQGEGGGFGDACNTHFGEHSFGRVLQPRGFAAQFFSGEEADGYIEMAGQRVDASLIGFQINGGDGGDRLAREAFIGEHLFGQINEGLRIRIALASGTDDNRLRVIDQRARTSRTGVFGDEQAE